MTRPRTAAALVLGLAAWIAAAAALAQQGQRIPVNVLVTHLSNQGGGVDPPARSLHQQLRAAGISNDSLHVLKKQRILMALDEVSHFDLPNGKAVRMRPIHKDERGVLMAVDVEGAAKLDVRVKSGHPVVIRAGPYKQGSLVLSLELDY